MSSYSLPIKKGSGWAYTVSVPNSAGWTLKLQIEQNGSFESPDIEKSVTATNGQITISGSASEYGQYKDARFRVVGTKNGRSLVLQSGVFTTVQSEEAPVLGDSGTILEDKLPERLSESVLMETFVTVISAGTNLSAARPADAAVVLWQFAAGTVVGANGVNVVNRRLGDLVFVAAT